jgi:hypothetical protein
MKKQTIYLFFAVLGFLFSCADENFDAGTAVGEEVDFTITASVPQDIVTYAGSGEGGISNVDPATYRLRYILEVRTKEANPQLAYRAYQIVEKDFATTSVSFSARLLALKYDFVFWADFTKKENPSKDLFYQTNNGDPDPNGSNDPGLCAIAIKGVPADYCISNEARDAYYGAEEVDLSQSSAIKSIQLKRPFGKIRFVATENLTHKPDSVYLTYETTFPTAFDALKNEVLSSASVPFTVGDTIKTGNVEIENVMYNNAYLLASDYIFVVDNQTVTCTITTTYPGPDEKSVKKIANIPVVRNKITTIAGDFLIP